MSKAARAKAKAELKAKKKAKDIEKKRSYEYGSWNLFVLITQLLGIHKLIPAEVVTRYTQAKIAKGPPLLLGLAAERPHPPIPHLLSLLYLA